jgi:hypothetical protein
MEALEPRPKGAFRVVGEFRESSDKFGPDPLGDFIGIDTIPKLGFCPANEHRLIAIEEFCPSCLIVDPLNASNQSSAGSRFGSVHDAELQIEFHTLAIPV